MRAPRCRPVWPGCCLLRPSCIGWSTAAKPCTAAHPAPADLVTDLPPIPRPAPALEPSLRPSKKPLHCPSNPASPRPANRLRATYTTPCMQLLGCGKVGGFAAAAAAAQGRRGRARRAPCPPQAGLFGDLFDFESWAPRSSQAWRLGNGTGGRRQQGGCRGAGARGAPRVCPARAQQTGHCARF